MNWNYQYVADPSKHHPQLTNHHILVSSEQRFFRSDDTGYQFYTSAISRQLGAGIERWNGDMVLDWQLGEFQRFMPSRLDHIVAPVWEVWGTFPIAFSFRTYKQVLLAKLALT